MFTGIIQSIGEITHRSGSRFTIYADCAPELAIGESVALSGMCSTVVEVADHTFSVDIMQESRRRTIFEEAGEGTRINLERAARMGDRISGHFVTGHIDEVGEIIAIEPKSDFTLVRIGVPMGDDPRDGISLPSQAHGGELDTDTEDGTNSAQTGNQPYTRGMGIALPGKENPVGTCRAAEAPMGVFHSQEGLRVQGIALPSEAHGGELDTDTEDGTHLHPQKAPANIRVQGIALLVEKGSVAVDGISLTVSAVGDIAQPYFEVSIIPHTWEVTTLRERTVGDTVNLEYDIIAKHVARLMQR